ncbi:hypothetical protein TIFTF001_014033 [Ficus carica]|uniref:SWIM-type domain-containing protein n=1 Tax=Ficus carica TaxID=3494 RepID=A0AA88D6M1_FICCA|nr:hypothetical protein TIFTF001_014033 [Ficus carica]
MNEVCVFINFNGQWDGTSRYDGGELKGILVPETATYVDLIQLVRSVIGISRLDKTIVMRYVAEPGLPPVRIQCDADVKFYIQLKKKDVHVLSKFPITIDVLKESGAEAMPPDVGESNHIDVHPSRVGGQSDEAIRPVNDGNLITLPPHIPSPIVCLDLHNDHGIDKQHHVFNPDSKTTHNDYNAGRLNVADAARHSNEKSTTPSIGAHSIANNIRSQSDNVPSSDSFFGTVVVADFTPVTVRVKRSNSTLLHVICIDNEGCPWQLRATRMRDSEFFVVKRYDDVHTCSIEIVQGHHRQAKSWMIGECVKRKYLDLTNTSYRPREIMRDMQAEFGVSFNYLRACTEGQVRRNAACCMRSRRKWLHFFTCIWHKGIENAANLVFPDAAFGICVQHLAANLKTRYKDFKGPLKTYFDGASRSYLLSEHNRHMESIRSRSADMYRYLLQTNPTKWSRAYFSGRRYAIMTINIAESLNSVDRKARLMPVGFLVEWLRELLQRWFVQRREEALKITSKLAPNAEKFIRTNFSLGLTVTPRPADHFEYSVTDNRAQIFIVDMSQRTYTCRRFQVDQIPCAHTMAVCNHRRIDPYNYCSNYYTKDFLYACYAQVVHPIGSAEGWDVFEEVRSQIVNPPKPKRGPGKPRVHRILSQDEELDPNRTTVITVMTGFYIVCKNHGHNRYDRTVINVMTGFYIIYKNHGHNRYDRTVINVMIGFYIV